MSGELHASWQHQLAGRAFALQTWEAGHPGVMLNMSMGSGKSKLAIDLIYALGIRLVLIVCPIRIVEVWLHQLEQHAAFPYLFRGLDERAGSVADKTKIVREAMAQARIGGQVCILAVNYETVCLQPFAGLAMNTPWPLIIADECVPPGSLISTPNGDVPIEDLRTGDLILGYDHASESTVVTQVTATFHHQTTNPLFAIRDARLTPEHPVWTNRGYIPARSVRASDEVLIVQKQKNLPQNLRVLPDRIHGTARGLSILQQGLPLQDRFRYAQIPPKGRRNYAQDDFPNRRTGKATEASDVGYQPIPPPRKRAQGTRLTEGPRILDAQRRQWTRPQPPTTTTGATLELANGMGCTDTGSQGFGLPQPLQDRHCGTSPTDCHRSGRLYAPGPADSRERQPQGCLPAVPRMAGAALLESRNFGRPGPSGESHPVHNLETGTGNYFVNGLLVHNCHRLKSPSGKQSRFMGRLALRARRRLGLTGTALPHSPLDIWGQYRFLDPSIYDDTFFSFKTRYAEWGGYQNRQVKKWRDMDDFHRRFYQIAFRVTKEEALPDLPPEMDQVLYTDLSPKGRHIYDQLENEFIAWLDTAPESEITIANALVLYLRLQQLTGGTLKDNAGNLHPVDDAKEKLLADWLEDLDPAEPAVIFARFHFDLDAIARACQHAGHTCVEVSGRSKHGITAWQAGGANVLAAQISIASEGQDLTRARYCVYYSVGWKLSDYVQSRARIHRPGQTRPVVYYHLLIRRSIDIIVQHALENRWDLVESVLKEMRHHHATRPAIH